MLKDWNKMELPSDEEIENRLKAARDKLVKQQIMMKEKKLPVIVLFEGWGAAGKGSVLGKVIKNIDPRFLRLQSWMNLQMKRKENHFYIDIL